MFWSGALRLGRAVLVRSGEVGYVPVGHGVVRLGKAVQLGCVGVRRVVFWCGKAVMAWKGYFRHGLAWRG